MMRTKWLRLLVLAVPMMLVAAGCPGREEPAAEREPEVGEEPPGEPAPAPGFDGTTIRLGVLTPTSGLVAIIGNPLTAGNQAYFDWLNETQGGIAGRYRVELVIEDTAYDATTALTKYAAIKDDVVLFVQALGTPIVHALLPELEADGIVANPASLDSRWVREPNLMPIGGPYQIQAINAVDWFFAQPENEGATMCTLASDDEYGDTGVEGVEFALENLGLELGHAATFPAPKPGRPAQTFDSQVAALQGAGCEAIFFVATPVDTGPLATKLAETPGYTPTVIGMSPTWLGLFAPNPWLQEHFYLASEGPEYGDTTVPGMAQLVHVQQTFAPEQAPDIYFNFGYLQAMAVTQVLEKAVELGDLSREGIKRAMEEVGTLTFDGLSGDYRYGTPEERDPPRVSSIFRPDPNRPMGLAIVERDWEAEFAADFEF